MAPILSGPDQFIPFSDEIRSEGYLEDRYFQPGILSRVITLAELYNCCI